MHQQHPFLKLLDQHSRAIDRLCKSFAKGDEMEYEDMRQEAIINLWIGWQRYQHTYKPITWVWRIVLNTCISWQRSNSKHKNGNTTLNFDLPVSTSESVAHQTLLELISLLPVKDQQLIGLYLDGWNLNEIAQMLSTTETNIQTRIYRIKKQLNKLSNE